MFSRLDEMENYRRPRVSASSLQKMRENSTGGVMTPEEAKTFEPKVVFVDDENQISRCTNYERHGRLEDM